ncbi:molybdopterin molybdotransferase MoeA [Roseobacteraceae bacterium NS-SX3]
MTIHERLDQPGCGCGETGGAGLLPLDTALARIADTAGPVAGTESVPLTAAAGRVLAKPVRARSMVPPFTNSAMDGYALNTTALTGAEPWELPVAGRIAAGQGAGRQPAGAAMQIFTGAPLPSGADAVVMQEQVERTSNSIRFSRKPLAGENIRGQGEDIARGETVVAAGCRLTPREIAVIAAAGHAAVKVRRRIRIAFLATGDEVNPAGSALQAAGIWDVNSPMLAAAMARPDAELVAVEHDGDDAAALERRLGQLLQEADLVITTGGVSVGAADHLRPAFAALGGETLFSGVAVKPGKPATFGRLGAAHWLGLPGNPGAAYVIWTVMGTAVLDRLAGAAAWRPARRHAVAGAELRHRTGRCELRLARIAGFDGLGREVVDCPAATHSHRTSDLAGADGLVLIPGDIQAVPEGGLVEFLPFCTG